MYYCHATVTNYLSLSMCACRRVVGLIEGSKGTVAYGGDTDEQTRYIQPTLITDVTPDEKLMQVGVATLT